MLNLFIVLLTCNAVYHLASCERNLVSKITALTECSKYEVMSQ